MTSVLWIGAILLWAVGVYMGAPLWAYAVIGLVWGAGCSFIANREDYDDL